MTKFPGMSKEASLILGALAAIVSGVVTIAGAGGFEDGFQLADLVPILAPLAAALGIRQSVFSLATVQKADAEVQKQERKRA